MLFPIIVIICFFSSSIAQEQWNSAQINHAIKKLNFLGSALYIAAHPDDENTRLISYLSNHVQANTAYLSLTRGDGGQNLIGTELKELLGVIRTQELLAARKLDGGKQFFTRANDFGYSKHPDETLAIWNKQEVLADVVWTIRNFKPDIIINRFKHDTPGSTHGHHTSSAVLSYEAFDLVGSEKSFPEQLKYTDVWQPKRLYMNTSWWFYGSREKFAKADKTRMLSVDAGVFYPHLGMSNGEIAMISRAQHRCQGMGRALNRGTQTEYLEVLKGEVPTNKEDLFDGVNTTWSRLKGGAPIGDKISKIISNFNFETPANSIGSLVEVYQMIDKLEDSNWKETKIEEIKEIILQCSGLYASVTASSYSAVKGEEVELTYEFTNRSNASLELLDVSVTGYKKDTTLNLVLNPNEENKFYTKVQIPLTASTSNPYWLNDKGTLGMYAVKDQKERGQPESPSAMEVAYNLKINNVSIPFSTTVNYKSVDPVEGESFRPFAIIPEVSVSIVDDVIIFADQANKTVEVKVQSGKAGVEGKLSLTLPSGWKSDPIQFDISLSKKEETQNFKFKLIPPKTQSEETLQAVVEIAGKKYVNEVVWIDYDHIPVQTIEMPNSAKIVKLAIEKKGSKIGYIMGAGDKIPESLKQIGYEVQLLEDVDMTNENLKKFDAIICGIRAYNTREKMKFHQSKLMDYVKNGGTYIVQYNTAHRLKVKSEELGPYPFKVSRDRVAVEEAEVRLLAKEHPVLNVPNKITEKDFENWVQERGLYFPSEWDEKYTPILSSNDPGEPARNGGLLVAEYGKGYYIYSGYSWFRELPAGVPGAFRLFANMISIGKE